MENLAEALEVGAVGVADARRLMSIADRSFTIKRSQEVQVFVTASAPAVGGCGVEMELLYVLDASGVKTDIF